MSIRFGNKIFFSEKGVDKSEIMCYYMCVPKMETRKEAHIMTNTSKLRGRMAEKGFYSLSAFSKAVNISRPCLRKRLNGASDFRASEIERVCTVLGIKRDEIGNYFFNVNVPKTETKEDINS